MYEFTILLLGGLLTLKTVDLLDHLTPKSMHAAAAVVVSALIGIGYAFLFDFSVFAAWDIGVRSEVVGTIATGLFMSALASVWPAMLGAVSGWIHRDEPQRAGETRLTQAA
ncbi:MAG TPA: hypothetical protein VNE62_10640 [Actinomycetota bacterium]|nr:hypothetical protein [Actinomycetota bacterium]